MARIYQPLGAALIIYVARVIAAPDTLDLAKARFLKAVLALALAANASVAFGPIARVPWAGRVYQTFYRHSFFDTMDVNLAQHGRRPLWFCR